MTFLLELFAFLAVFILVGLFFAAISSGGQHYAQSNASRFARENLLAIKRRQEERIENLHRKGHIGPQTNIIDGWCFWNKGVIIEDGGITI